MSVDSRIVTMKFDNTTFQRGVTSTLDLLSKLKTAVGGLGTSKTLGAVDTSKATSGLGAVGAAADGIGSKFSAMSVVAVTALATIAHKATETALGFAKGFTIAPILDGLAEYQLNLQSIQTIQANTDRPLTEINNSLDELNRYSDQTIYNFAEMAKNIGTFTAAGVELKTATSAIKGIANMAALSGSTSQQAAGAMYQLSQAIASGKVGLMDWNSVVNAGMGGKKLQTALAQTAVAMGELEKDAIKGTGALDQLTISGSSFRESISATAGDDPWLTSKVLENTLASLDGRFSKLALSTAKAEDGTLLYNKAQVQARMDASRLAMEQKNGVKYTEEQYAALRKLSDSSFLAATQVKTLSQVFDVAKETMASGWAATFRNIFGDFEEAKTTFTALSGFINDGINSMALARNKVLSRWNELGGRSAVIEGLKNAFKALANVLTPIGQAFREVFPATTARELVRASRAFRDWTEGLIAGKGTMENIKNIFGAIFGVLGIGVEIFKGVVRYVFDFISLLAGGTGGMLDFSGSLAEVIKGFTDFVLKGDYIARFFDTIIAGRAKLLEPIISFLSDMLSILGGLVDSGAEVVFENISKAVAFLTPYLPVLEQGLRDAGTAVQNYLVDGFEKLQPVLQTAKEGIADVLEYLGGIGESIGKALGGFSGVGSSIGGAFGGLGSMFDIGDSADKAADGIDKVKSALGGAGDSASSGAQSGLAIFGSFIKGFGDFLVTAGGKIVEAIAWIASGVASGFTGLLGAPGDIIGALGGFVGGIFGWLADAFRDISFGDVVAAMTTVIMGGIGLSITRLLYHISGMFKGFSGIVQGLGATTQAFGSSMENLGKAANNQARADLILNLGIALGVLAAALWVLSTIPADDLTRSLGAVAALMIMMAIAMKVLDKAMPDATTWKDGVKNMLSSMGAAARMAAMGTVMVSLAGSILLLALAMKIIAKLSPGEITKGLITIGLLLGGIVAAQVALEKSGGAGAILRASVAMGILAFALMGLAAAIKLYSMMDPDTLLNGGLAIGGILLAIGASMRAFPEKGAVGSAAAMLVMSGALIIIAKALQMVAQLSAGDSIQAIVTLGAMLWVLSAAANAMVIAMPGAQAMIVMAAAIAILAASLVLLGSMSLGELGIALIALAGALIIIGLAAAAMLYSGAIAGLILMGPAIQALGMGLAFAGGGMLLFAMGLTMLAAMGSAATVMLINNINTFLEAIPGFIQRLGDSLMEAINQIRKSGPAMMQAVGVIMRSFLKEVIKTVPLIGKAFRVIIAEALKTLRAAVPDMVRTGFAILMAFLNGLRKNISAITSTAVDIAIRFINGIAKKMDAIVNAGYNLVEKFVKAVAKKIGEKASELKDDMWDMAVQMISGLTGGLVDYGLSRVEGAVRDLAGAIPGPIKKLLGISSPSRVLREVGAWTAEGLALGIEDGTHRVRDEAEGVGKTALDTLRTTMNGVSDALALDPNMSPVITPVLDLTRLTNEANRIGTLLDTQPLQASVSYSAASALAAEQQAALEASVDGSGDSGDIIFEQHLHSPKPLDQVTIYRSTRNQFSIAKEALTK